MCVCVSACACACVCVFESVVHVCVRVLMWVVVDVRKYIFNMLLHAWDLTA